MYARFANSRGRSRSIISGSTNSRRKNGMSRDSRKEQEWY
jgi:hypothetical protein